jgi:hypothetical protein
LVFNGVMAMLNYDVFEAFKSAGADDDKARRAAEALAQDQGRFGKIEAKLDLHSWILAFNTAMIVAVLWRVFTP